MGGDTIAEKYEHTMAKVEQITRDGYQVEVQWKCKFDGEILDRQPELKTTSSTTQPSVDVMSIYPYICKYFKLPIRHSVNHVGDACQDKGRAAGGSDKIFDITAKETIALYFHLDATTGCYSVCAEHITRSRTQ